MTERLQRILSLSKRTGDTVVVHDPTEPHDLVILPFDQYETLVSSEREYGDCDEYLLEEMSERELIDKINRDIGIWRSYQELNERDRTAAMIEEQLTEEPLPDPFEEDFSHRSDWHRVSDLIETHRKKKIFDRNEDESDPVQTYIPVEDSPVISSVDLEPRVELEKENSVPSFDEETPLETEEDPVFFEEPIS